MRKKYTLQLVKFQIKTYYHKAFSLLKYNHFISSYDNRCYKRTILKNFMRICFEEKNKFYRKGEVYTFFTRMIKLKSVYSTFKLKLKNKKEAKRLRCYFLSYQFKSFYYQFALNALALSRRNNLYLQYNVFFVKRLYIIFFKSACKAISYKSKRLKKYNDATELHLYKLSLKALRKLKENVLLTQKEHGNQSRKRLIMRIYYKNLKALLNDYNRRCYYYRCLHLNKYYLNRLSRVTKALGNNRIAKFKFVSKWIMIWKEMVLKHKRTRAEGIVLLIKLLEKIKIKYIVKALKMFYSKLKEKNRSILKMQINDIKCLKYIQLRLMKLKSNIIKEVRYNMLINRCINKKKILLTKAIFQILKFIKDTSIPMYIKEEEAVNHYKKKSYQKIVRPYINLLKKNISVNRAKFRFFRVTMLKIKIIKLLKGFKAKSKKENNRRVMRFRQYFLMYNYMNMMKKHSLILYRENKILSGIKRKIAHDRLSYMKWGFRSFRNNLIVKRCKRRKMFKLIIQVLTALKMLSMQNGYRLSDTSYECNSNDNDNDNDSGNGNEYDK